MKKLNKTLSCLFAMTFMALGTSSVFAKDVAPNIAVDKANLPTDLTFNIAKIAMANGVKEPLNIAKEGGSAKISGSNSTICAIKLSNDTQILGVSCK